MRKNKIKSALLGDYAKLYVLNKSPSALHNRIEKLLSKVKMLLFRLGLVDLTLDLFERQLDACDYQGISDEQMLSKLSEIEKNFDLILEKLKINRSERAFMSYFTGI